MGNYAFPSQLSIIFEIPDDNERVHSESLKDNSDNYTRMSNTSTHEYSKTLIYRAPIYLVPRFTRPQFYLLKTSFVCKSV